MAKYPGKRYGRKGGRRVRKSTKPNIKRAIRSAKDKMFAKKVQRVISKDTETKVVVFSSAPTAYNQPINATGDCLRLMPQIFNGTAENQKLGNVIRLQSLNVRGVLTFTQAQASASNTRIGVRLLILKAKRFSDWNAAAIDFNTNYTKLLEGSLTGFTGNVSDFNTPINHDYFSVVMDKRMYMSQSLISANAALANSTSDNINTTKFINFNVPYSRRNVKYDQDFSTGEPIDYPYFMCVGYCKLDGASPDAPGTTYLTMQYTATAKFEDA